MNFSTALFPGLSDYATDAAIALRHAKIAFSEWFEIPYPSFTSEANTREIEIIQRTSDHLREQGWLHLPELVSREDGREVIVRKTAAGVVDDMNAFTSARKRLEAS